MVDLVIEGSYLILFCLKSFLKLLSFLLKLLSQLCNLDISLLCVSITLIMPLSPIIYHLFTKLVDIIIITCRWLYRAASLIQVCADVVR